MKKTMIILTAALMLILMFTGFAAAHEQKTPDAADNVLLIAPAPAAELTASDVKAVIPENFKASSSSYTKIKCSWDKIDGIDGYIVYRATSKNGTYKKCYSTDNPDKTYYINTGRTTGKTYWYKTRGYKIIDGKTYYTKYSAADDAYARPNKVKITDVYGNEVGWSQVVIDWNKVSGATGYQLQINQKKDGHWTGWRSYSYDEYFGKTTFTTYESLLKITKQKHPDGYIEKLIKKDGKLVRVKKTVEEEVADSIGKTQAWIDVIQDESEYKFRIRAYHTENGKKVYGLWSDEETLDETLDINNVVSALREYTKDYAAKNYPEFKYDDTRTNSTDQNSSYYVDGAFGGFSRYAREEEVIETYKDNINRYIANVINGGGVDTGFIYARMSYPGDRDGVGHHVSEGTYYAIWMLY